MAAGLAGGWFADFRGVLSRGTLPPARPERVQNSLERCPGPFLPLGVRERRFAGM